MPSRASTPTRSLSSWSKVSKPSSESASVNQWSHVCASYSLLCNPCLAENYDEFSARHHVQHVRSVLVSPPTFAASLGAANVTPSSLRGSKNALEELAQAATPGTNMSVLATKEKPEVCECIGSVVFSRFNPPPGQRRLKGDLLYLEVIALLAFRPCCRMSFWFSFLALSLYAKRPATLILL